MGRAHRPSTDRLLALLDDDRNPTSRRVAIRSFELIFIMVMLAEYWLRAAARGRELGPDDVYSLAVSTVLLLMAFRVSWRRAAFLGLAVSHAIVVWRDFPATGNHAYLEVVLCLVAVFLEPYDPSEARLYLRAVRWTVVLVFVWSGVQKAVHGYWLGAQYLAFSLDEPNYRQVLGVLMPESELERLMGYDGRVGDGPYRVSSWPLVLIANVTWIAEIALGVLLLLPRTRRPATVAALLFLAAVEVAAREMFFGLVFANALLLFSPDAAHRRAIPVFAATIIVMALIRFGVLPEVEFY